MSTPSTTSNQYECPEWDSLPSLKLKGKKSTWLNQLLSAKSVAHAAVLMRSIARRLSMCVPVKMTLDDVIGELRQHIPVSIADREIVEKLLSNIRIELEKILKWRKARALDGFSMSGDSLERHNVETVTELPKLTPPEYNGVLLLNTPMGSGKTRKIAKPFAQWTKDQPGRLVATCHRQSLVRELAREMDCIHYRETKGKKAEDIKAFATCLPSIVKREHTEIIENFKYLIVDEIAQVLCSVTSDVAVADNKTPADVYETLRQMVRNADCIIGADAGMNNRVLAFLENCRPTDERFRIISQPHKNQGFTVQYGYGEQALVNAYGEALARLSQGERLWISCGESIRAEEITRVLEMAKVRVLLLCGKTREEKQQADFWLDPERVSCDYDCVVHTGVISSGLSIEHKGCENRFTHGMLIASGATITPAEALQMLRRVRYLRTWTVAVMPNRVDDIDSTDAILTGMLQAADLQKTTIDCTDFDLFAAGVRADNARQRADFAAGLWWGLEHQGFNIQRMELVTTDALAEELNRTRETICEEHRERILHAQDLTSDEVATLLKTQVFTQTDQARLLRHRIKTELGLSKLTTTDLVMWDYGRGLERMDRFSAATLGIVALKETMGRDLRLHDFGKARVLAYQMLFDGLKLAPNLRITPAHAQLIIERVIQHRYLLAFLGIVPAKWAKYLRTGQRYQNPAYPTREVGEILRRMGLVLNRKMKHKKSTKRDTKGNRSVCYCLDEMTQCVTQERKIVATEVWHEITEKSWKCIARYADYRNHRYSGVASSVTYNRSLPQERTGNRKSRTQDDLSDVSTLEQKKRGCIRAIESR